MMNYSQLPGSILQLLEKDGVHKEDIRSCLYMDLDHDCFFQDQYLVLTDQLLYFFQGEKKKETVHFYKGYGTRENEQVSAGQCWSCTDFFLERIDRVEMEQQVACNTLVVTLDGAQTCIGVFTNSHKGAVREFIRCFEHIQKGESPEPEEDSEEELYCPKCGRMYPDAVRKVCPKCMNRKTIFARVLQYFRPYLGRILLIAAAILLTSLSDLIWPYLNGTVLYDRILAKSHGFLVQLGIENGHFVTALLYLVITMFLAKVFFLLVQMVRGILIARVVNSVVKDMKQDIFANMGKLSIRFFKDRQTGSLMTRVMSDADRVTDFFFDGLPWIFIYGFTMIASLVVMFCLNWRMTVVAVVLVPLCGFCSFYMKPRVWVKYGRRHRAERSLNSTINDNLTGSRVVKSFGREEGEKNRFRGPNDRLKKAEIDIVKQQNSFRVLYGSAQEITTIAVWIIGVSLMIREGSVNMGMLITFVGYVAQLSGPMNFFANIFNSWAQSMNSAQRMFEIMDAVPEVQESLTPRHMPNPKGELKLEHVSFGYDQNRTVLKDISFEVAAGSTLGIVGYSGAGKTTLVQLISRLYDVSEGSIYIDGVNVKDWSFHDLRKNIAMVSQDTYIFMGTVAENIAYADGSADRLDIVRAAKLAGAHEFIMRMQDGYDTRIGSGGRSLSGGERQRLSIARAILADPKILILDEATASVDTETERAIQCSLQYLSKNRTTLSIAHRLSTLRDADYLIVLENGCITERGSREELYELKGTYYKLLQLQNSVIESRLEEETI